MENIKVSETKKLLVELSEQDNKYGKGQFISREEKYGSPAQKVQ